MTEELKVNEDVYIYIRSRLWVDTLNEVSPTKKKKKITNFTNNLPLLLLLLLLIFLLVGVNKAF